MSSVWVRSQIRLLEDPAHRASGDPGRDVLPTSHKGQLPARPLLNRQAELLGFAYGQGDDPALLLGRIGGWSSRSRGIGNGGTHQLPELPLAGAVRALAQVLDQKRSPIIPAPNRAPPTPRK